MTVEAKSGEWMDNKSKKVMKLVESCFLGLSNYDKENIKNSLIAAIDSAYIDGFQDAMSASDEINIDD